MLYRPFEIDELLSSKDADREIVDLMENNGAHLKLISLKKHQVIEPHMSHTDVCLFVTDGELEIKFSKEDNCICQACGCSMPEEDEKHHKFKIKKGQLFMFQKNVMHIVEALKDTVFLVIKI